MAKTIRPEVLAFVFAAQNLITREAIDEPLSDSEMEKVVDYLALLEEVILESTLTGSGDGTLPRVEDDRHGDGHSSNGDGHP